MMDTSNESAAMFDFMDASRESANSGLQEDIFQSIISDPLPFVDLKDNTHSFHHGGNFGYEDLNLISQLEASSGGSLPMTSVANGNHFGYDDVLASMLDMDGSGGANSLTASLSSIPSPPSSPAMSTLTPDDSHRVDLSTSPLKRSSENSLRSGPRSPKAPKLQRGADNRAAAAIGVKEERSPSPTTSSTSPTPNRRKISPRLSPEVLAAVTSQSTTPTAFNSATSPTPTTRKPRAPSLPISLELLKNLNDNQPVTLPSRPISPRRAKSPRSPRDRENAHNQLNQLVNNANANATNPPVTPAVINSISAVQETISKLDQTTRNIMKESLERLAKKAESQTSSACCSEVNSPRSPAPSSLISPREPYSLSDSLRDISSDRSKSPTPQEFETLEQKVINLFLNVASPLNSPRGRSASVGASQDLNMFDATPAASLVSPRHQSTPASSSNSASMNTNNAAPNTITPIPPQTITPTTIGTFPPPHSASNGYAYTNGNGHSGKPLSNSSNGIYDMNQSPVGSHPTNGGYSHSPSPRSPTPPNQTSPPVSAPMMVMPMKQTAQQQQQSQQQASIPPGATFLATPSMEGIPTAYVFAAPAATYVNAHPWWAVNIGGGQQRIINSSLYPYMINNRTVLLPNTPIDQNSQNVAFLTTPQYSGATQPNGSNPLTAYYSQQQSKGPSSPSKTRKRSTSTGSTRRRRSIGARTPDTDAGLLVESLTSSCDSIVSPQSGMTPSPPPTNLSSVLSPTTTPPPDMASLRLTSDYDYVEHPIPHPHHHHGMLSENDIQVFNLGSEDTLGSFSVMDAMEFNSNSTSLNPNPNASSDLLGLGSNSLDVLLVDGFGSEKLL